MPAFEDVLDEVGDDAGDGQVRAQRSQRLDLAGSQADLHLDVALLPLGQRRQFNIHLATTRHDLSPF